MSRYLTAQIEPKKRVVTHSNWVKQNTDGVEQTRPAVLSRCRVGLRKVWPKQKAFRNKVSKIQSSRSLLNLFELNCRFILENKTNDWHIAFKPVTIFKNHFS